MKSLIIGLTFMVSTAHAIDCPPLTLQGNTGWFNNNSSLLQSSLTDEFSGGNCEDQVFVTANKNSNQANYFYMMSILDQEANRLDYSFSLDFADILSILSSSKQVDIFEMYVLPTYFVSPNLLDNKVLTVSIIKLDTGIVFSDNNRWSLNFVWTDLVDESGQSQVVNTHVITFSEDITEGLIHIDVNWNNHNLNGGSVNASVYTNIFKTLSNTNQTILLTSDDGEYIETGLKRVVMNSDHFIKGVAPSLYKIGIINPDSGVSFGDGITFYTPYRD